MAARLGDGSGEINAAAARIAKPESVRRALDLLRPGLVADGGNAELDQRRPRTAPCASSCKAPARAVPRAR